MIIFPIAYKSLRFATCLAVKAIEFRCKINDMNKQEQSFDYRWANKTVRSIVKPVWNQIRLMDEDQLNVIIEAMKRNKTGNSYYLNYLAKDFIVHLAEMRLQVYSFTIEKGETI
jgi:hypothetical protein